MATQIEISQETVDTGIKNLKSEIDSLPNVGTFENTFDKFKEVIELLKICWNTCGGKKQAKRLEDIAGSLDSLKLSESINELKKVEINRYMVYNSEEFRGPFIGN